MLDAPKRITLVVQVADILRRGLRDQHWTKRLPSEKLLAHQLQVSRMTLRRALKIMVEEKRLLVVNGKKAEILTRQVARTIKSKRTIGVISPVPVDATSRYAPYYESYRTCMQNGGVEVNFHFGSRFYGNRPGKALEALVSEGKTDLWILLGSTPPLQSWFFERGIPSIVDGSCHAGVCLPALDMDYRSLCRHAARVLIGLGHRRIVFLLIKSGAGGDLASEAGFIEAKTRGVESHVIRCDGSVASICRTLDRLFRSGPRPTAIFTHLWLPFTVLSYLQRNNIRVPEDVSLIARDDQPNLETLVPAIARYGMKPDRYTQRLIRMTWKFFDGTLLPQQEYFTPDFMKGGSLASLNSAAEAN